MKCAVALTKKYLEWREKVHYEANTPTNLEQIRNIMEDELFTCPSNELDHGRPVLAVRYKYLDTKMCFALDAARTLGFIIEWMLHMHPKAQTYGIVVGEVVARFPSESFDLRLLSFMESAFTETLSARILTLLVTDPGFFIKFMIGLFANFSATSSGQGFDCSGREEMESLRSVF